MTSVGAGEDCCHETLVSGQGRSYQDPQDPRATFRLHPALAYPLREWHAQTPYARDDGFCISVSQGRRPRARLSGRVRCRPSPAGSHQRQASRLNHGQRFGLHNLRHSLSSWLVNKAKVEPKTVQSILRHSRIQTTLDLYTQGDGDETRAAQGAFLKELGMASEMIQ